MVPNVAFALASRLRLASGDSGEMSSTGDLVPPPQGEGDRASRVGGAGPVSGAPTPPSTCGGRSPSPYRGGTIYDRHRRDSLRSHAVLDAQPRPRVAFALAAPAFDEAGELGIVGHVDHQGDELVAALPVLAGEALALEPQHLARARPLGNAQHHRAVDRRHPHLGAEHRFVERHRQIEADIVAFATEEAVRLDRDGDNRVAIAARPRLALPAEADPGAVLDARGKLDVERLAAAQGHPLAVERRGVLERHFEPVGDVGAALRRRAAPAEAAETPAAAP